MSTVISFISRKGGTGKTTNAINIATTLSQMGKKVLLIETDINYTLTELRKKELQQVNGTKLRFPDLMASEETSVVKEIKNGIKEAYDFIIVDSAGNTSEYGTNRLCVNSDLVVIPTSLSDNDMAVTSQTITDITPAVEENPALKVVILPVRIHSRTKYENVRQALSGFDVEIFEDFIPTRKHYTKISTIQPAEGYQLVTQKIISLI